VDDVAGRKRLLAEFGIEVGGGLGEYKGKAWRIGLMGYNSRPNCVFQVLVALEQVLRGAGVKIEPGSGVGIKTKRLLRALRDPASYIGIDVTREALEYAARVLRAEHPDLDVHTVVADFTRPFALPAPRRPVGRTLVFFPGSTIGNFEPHDAVAFLGGLRRSAGDNSLLLLGADGTREPKILEAAYNDAEGVTAAFDKNVLAHLNRVRGTTFDVDAFEHRAIWNERYSRIEMRLIATREQHVVIDGHHVDVAIGEPIITEYSYKHSVPALRGILLAAGWQVREVFTGKEQPMRLWLCEPRAV
jgi:dimethylhistidine N-methyltransferase